MHDIRLIRDNPADFDAGLKKRGNGFEGLSSELVQLDEKRRSLIASAQEMQERRNAASKEIGQAKAQKDETRAQALMAEVSQLKERMPAVEAEMKEAEEALRTRLAGIPNIPADDVPLGADEHDNVERHRHGEPKSFSFTPHQHFEIGESLKQMDFETAAKLSGSRFVITKGPLARLERALGQFMLDTHVSDHGYLEVHPPVLVRDDAMFGTAQLPKFRDDQFRAGDDYWLIPTAEVPLTNMVREAILEEKELPLRFAALTPCFRAEAGAAGRDTRGMIRQHQFDKVEMVSITTPETSADEHERMLGCAEAVLKKLDLAYRVVTLCTGDMGFSARKTYDIEVWLPGQNAYREISSCSVCGDFQARRMDARYRPAGGKGTSFVHTLNGSGTAVGRALVAVLETYQNEDGSVSVPEVLKPYMGGVTRIEKGGT